jgi:hypothetical protein
LCQIECICEFSARIHRPAEGCQWRFRLHGRSVRRCREACAIRRWRGTIATWRCGRG